VSPAAVAAAVQHGRLLLSQAYPHSHAYAGWMACNENTDIFNNDPLKNFKK
jgi:hypothetical protein